MEPEDEILKKNSPSLLRFQFSQKSFHLSPAKISTADGTTIPKTSRKRHRSELHFPRMYERIHVAFPQLSAWQRRPVDSSIIVHVLIFAGQFVPVKEKLCRGQIAGLIFFRGGRFRGLYP